MKYISTIILLILFFSCEGQNSSPKKLLLSLPGDSTIQGTTLSCPTVVNVTRVGNSYRLESLSVGYQTYLVSSCIPSSLTNGWRLITISSSESYIVELSGGVIQTISQCYP